MHIFFTWEFFTFLNLPENAVMLGMVSGEEVTQKLAQGDMPYSRTPQLGFEDGESAVDNDK